MAIPEKNPRSNKNEFVKVVKYSFSPIIELVF